jgi:acetate---CoA ligase (ADP-forming)
MSPLSVERLLRPKSVAIIGASPDPASIGGAPVRLFERFNYQGALHLISRSHRTIAGRPCFGSIEELPEGVDVAILAVPASALSEVLRACAQRNVRAAVAFASGFAEMGAEGRAAQESLAREARRAGIALAGPNCLGAVNFVDRVPLTFGAVEPAASNKGPALGIVAQSGAMSFALLYAAASEEIPLSYVISTGNEAVLAVEEYLEFLVQDEATRAIALLVEQIRDPPRFMALARAARRAGKALCILHTGTSARGRTAAASHTGALAGDQAILRVVLRREGVVFVDTLDELIDVAGVLTRCRATGRKAGIAFLTDSGAMKSHALDVCEKLNVDLPEPSEGTLGALRAVLPPFAVPSNPADITAQALNNPALYAEAGRALLEDPAVDALVVAAMPGSPLQFSQQLDALLPAVASSSKPILYAVMGGQLPLPAEGIARIRAARLPLFRSAERALVTASRLLEHARGVCAAEAREAEGSPNDAAARARPRAEFTGGALAEHRGKALLRAWDIAVPEGALAQDVEEAARAAQRIGYPVALKAQAAQLLHKSEVGGVRLGIASEPALRAAWAELLDSVRTARPDLALEGVLVERMAPTGIEIVVGGRRDPQWGPVLLVGLGGVWIEILRDVRILAADASRDEIRSELRRLQAWPLLAGARGAPPADVGALVATIETLGRMLFAMPELAELEVNPLVVRADGLGVVALDAVFVSAEMGSKG